MMQAFDEKNNSNFKKNTELLISAVNKIKKTNALPATIAELSRMTGLHRNAISNRQWPGKELQEIKNERKKIKNKQVEISSDVNPITVLEEKLADAKRELVYWFTKCSDNELKINQLTTNLNRMSQARDSYEDMLKQERAETKKLLKELEQLKALIR